MKPAIDTFLHPIRMRILVALSGEQLSAQELSSILTDIPQATLYRHLGTLARAGLITVVAERPVRGTLEKVYALHDGSATLTHSDLAGMSKEEHLRLFVAFTTALVKEFEHYLNSSEQVDYVKDGVGYHQLPLFLSDEELQQLSIALNSAMLPFLNLPSAPGRRKRMMSTVMMPAATLENQTNPAQSK
jgi:DNA-binding transcriptional ArsR family regulator